MVAKIVIIINLILVVIMAIFEWRKPQSIIFWLVIIFLFSIFGFLAYVVLGNRLKFKSKKIIINKQKSTKNYLRNCPWYVNYKKNNNEFKLNHADNIKLNTSQIKLIKYFKNKFNFKLWRNNNIDIFTSGKDFFNEFVKDLKSAKESINLEFYIFANDKTGQTIVDILCEKAKEGLSVKVIYDEIGSRDGVRVREKLEGFGVRVVSFFPSLFKLKLINFKINYRNHRKIAIIDGKISYTGGVNLRDDHMGINTKLTPWRDTQIKINGHATYALQNIFLNDWCFAKNIKLEKNEVAKFFPQMNNNIGAFVQILSSGPEDQEQKIKASYLKIINEAKTIIYIQTPYFVIDSKLKNALIEAKKRGVDVKIMIPIKPDKKMVYQCSLGCINELFKNNIDIYLYNGFIHAKTLLTESVLSVGSCNFDNRSFNLNFETTALVYDNKIICEHNEIFNNDIANSEIMTKTKFKKMYNKNIFVRVICYLMSKLV